MESMVRVQPVGCDFTLDAPARNQQWYESRGYEMLSTAIFRTVARGARTVIDIGAHVGYYSLLARSADPTSTIVAIEASPDNAAVLRANVDGLAGVTVVNAAFGAVSGTATFYLTEASDNCGLSGHPDSPTTRAVEVAAITGADLDVPGGGRLLVKLDVEGHEVAALDGLKGLFGAYDDVRLLVEFNPKCLTAAGSSPDDLIARLHAAGFRLFVLDDVELSWRELAAGRSWSELVDARDYANLYCVPKDRAITMTVAMHSGGLGGAERTHAEMTDWLIRDGAMVHTVIPEPDLGLSGELQRLGGSVTMVSPFQWWMTWPDDVVPTGDAESWSRHLVHEPLITAIRQVQPDLVMTLTGVIPQGAIAAAATGRPHVWYVHEFGDLDHGLVVPGGPRSTGALILALSDAVLTNSAAVRKHFFGANNTQVSVLHPVPAVVVAAERPTVVARPWTLGIVASLNAGKGQEDALGAIAVLRGEGTDVPLVLAGPGTDTDRQRIGETAERLAVSDLVTIAGVCPDRTALYDQFDAVAMTSRSEAFGRIPFEATAVGLPVIYADAGGPREYMQRGVTGMAYSPGDVGALAAAILTLRNEPTRGYALVEAARLSLLEAGREDGFGNALTRVLRTVRDRRPRAELHEVVGWLAATLAARDREITEARSDLDAVVAAHEALVPQYQRLVTDHDYLVRGHLGIVDALDTLRTDHAHLRTDHAHLRTELDELTALHSTSRENNRALRSSIEGWQATLTAAQDAQDAALARLVEVEATADELRASRDLIVNSRTWRARSALASAMRPQRRR